MSKESPPRKKLKVEEELEVNTSKAQDKNKPPRKILGKIQK